MELVNSLALSLVLAPFVFSACATALEGDGKSLETQLRQKLDDLIEDSETPGIQYILVGAEQVLFQYNAGVSDVGKRKAIDARTMFMTYSLTKTFTAAAVLRLVDQGKVALDDDLSEYTPEAPYGHGIQIRHLLSQTSGIPNPIPLRWVHLAKDHAGFDESGALDAVMKANPNRGFMPGEKYQYSNISYWLLGRVIEKASGQSYASYMREQLFAPLAIESEMSFDSSATDRVAKGYIPRWSWMNLAKFFVSDSSYWGEYEDGWLNIRPHYLNGPAFGGLVASAQGVARFLQDQLAATSMVLSAETRVRFLEQQKNLEEKPVPMTLGWHVDQLDGTPYLYKEGGGMGYHAEMRLYPSLGLGSVMLVNSGTFNTRKTLSVIDRIALKKR